MVTIRIFVESTHSNAVQNTVHNLEVGIFCHIKPPSLTIYKLHYCSAAFASFLLHPTDWKQGQWIFILHLMYSPTRNQWDMHMRNGKKKLIWQTFFDFHLQPSFNSYVFFPWVPLPVHGAIQAITSFIWTVGESASSFSSCVSHVSLPIFPKAGLKGGWAPPRIESPGFRDSLPCGSYKCSMVPDILDRCPKPVTSFSLLILRTCPKWTNLLLFLGKKFLRLQLFKSLALVHLYFKHFHVTFALTAIYQTSPEYDRLCFIFSRTDVESFQLGRNW